MYLGVLAFLSLLLLTAYVSYAVFSVKEEKSGTLNIVTGTLYSHMESSELDSNHQITVSAGETKSFNVTLRNINNRSVKMNFYYQWITTNPGNVEIGYATTSQDVPPTNVGYVLGINDSKVITIGIKNNSGSAITLKFGSNVGLEKPTLDFPENSYALVAAIKLMPIYIDNSGANAPELVTGLIPVVYSEEEANWLKADTSSGWYAYQDQIWANAVTVTETNRTAYLNATPGTVIPITDINTMWVWIPRYSYTIKENSSIFDIKFVDSNIKENGTSKYSSSPVEYYTHPSFTYNNKELSGIWVGKFELGGIAPNNCVSESCDVSDLVIKPNVNSIFYNSIQEFYYLIKSMGNLSSIYSFDSNNSDIHMMKSIDWGSVLYLTQSSYGKIGNNDFSNDEKEIYLNNYYANESVLTGCSSGTFDTPVSKTCAYTYEKVHDGTGASTTGNIYGIYDMNGGRTEALMGLYTTADLGISTTNDVSVNKYYSVLPLAPEMCWGGDDSIDSLECSGFTKTWYRQNAFTFDLYNNQGGKRGDGTNVDWSGGPEFSLTTLYMWVTRGACYDKVACFLNFNTTYRGIWTFGSEDGGSGVSGGGSDYATTRAVLIKSV